MDGIDLIIAVIGTFGSLVFSWIIKRVGKKTAKDVVGNLLQSAMPAPAIAGVGVETLQPIFQGNNQLIQMVVENKADLDQMRMEIDKLKKDNRELKQDNQIKTQEIVELKKENTEQAKKIHQQDSEIERLKELLKANGIEDKKESDSGTDK